MNVWEGTVYVWHLTRKLSCLLFKKMETTFTIKNIKETWFVWEVEVAESPWPVYPMSGQVEVDGYLNNWIEWIETLDRSKSKTGQLVSIARQIGKREVTCLFKTRSNEIHIRTCASCCPDSFLDIHSIWTLCDLMRRSSRLEASNPIKSLMSHFPLNRASKTSSWHG